MTTSVSRTLAKKILSDDTRFVVTGASGWMGRATLALLEDLLGTEVVQRVLPFGSHTRALTLPSGKLLECQKIADLENLKPDRYVFLHLAFLGKERSALLPLSDYVRANEELAECVTSAARRLRPVGIFLPSSGAVYRQDRTIDDNLERNPYGVLKHRDERRFTALTENTASRLIIVRIFNLAGPFINKTSSYVLSSILLDLLAGRPIELRADYKVIRSFVHVCDFMALVLRGLLDPAWKHEPPFDTAGETELEIGELALRAAAVLGRPEHPIKRPAVRTDSVDRYVGDGRHLSELARRCGLSMAPISSQIQSTADYLRALCTPP